MLLVPQVRRNLRNRCQIAISVSWPMIYSATVQVVGGVGKDEKHASYSTGGAALFVR